MRANTDVIFMLVLLATKTSVAPVLVALGRITSVLTSARIVCYPGRRFGLSIHTLITFMCISFFGNDKSLFGARCGSDTDRSTDIIVSECRNRAMDERELFHLA